MQAYTDDIPVKRHSRKLSYYQKGGKRHLKWWTSVENSVFLQLSFLSFSSRRRKTQIWLVLHLTRTPPTCKQTHFWFLLQSGKCCSQTAVVPENVRFCLHLFVYLHFRTNQNWVLPIYRKSGHRYPVLSGKTQNTLFWTLVRGFMMSRREDDVAPIKIEFCPYIGNPVTDIRYWAERRKIHYFAL